MVSLSATYLNVESDCEQQLKTELKTSYLVLTCVPSIEPCRRYKQKREGKNRARWQPFLLYSHVPHALAHYMSCVYLTLQHQEQDNCEHRESVFQIGEAYQQIKQRLMGGRYSCKVFGILVVGEIGTGKSALINNLLMKESTNTLESTTSKISKFKTTVEGVDVVLYDTPGLGDTRVPDYGEQHLKQMKAVLDNNEIQLVLYCFKMTETRMRTSLVDTFVEYHRIGVNWEHTVMVLTFADCLPVPKSERKKPEFQMSQYFNDRVAKWHQCISTTLVERVGVEQRIVEKIKVCPSTFNRSECLPNGEPWFVPLWQNVLELLSPDAEEHFPQLPPRTLEAIKKDRGGGCINQ